MSKTKQRVPTLLNLGCGEDYRSEWHNVDLSPAVDADETVDLDDYPWPFPSDHFAHIEARHVFEHLADPMQALQEVARILVAGGTICLIYPIGHTRFEDPTHKQFWNWHTAEALAGTRKHGHEHATNLRLVGRDVDWRISEGEPLVWAYTRYRLWARGPGPWLEQIPGLYGEVTATYEFRP